MRAAGGKGTSELVAPHDLSSKFLLRMRGEDRSPPLAFLDQQTVLRSMFGVLRPPAVISSSINDDHVAGRRSVDWTRNQARTATTGDRATRECTGSAELIEYAGTSRG
jgi:hypothetical protein